MKGNPMNLHYPLLQRLGRTQLILLLMPLKLHSTWVIRLGASCGGFVFFVSYGLGRIQDGECTRSMQVVR